MINNHLYAQTGKPDFTTHAMSYLGEGVPPEKQVTMSATPLYTAATLPDSNYPSYPPECVDMGDVGR